MRRDSVSDSILRGLLVGWLVGQILRGFVALWRRIAEDSRRAGGPAA